MMRTEFYCQKRILMLKNNGPRLQTAAVPVKIDSLSEAVYFCAAGCFSLSFLVSIKYNIEYIKM